jgi:hypothetical protein
MKNGFVCYFSKLHRGRTQQALKLLVLQMRLYAPKINQTSKGLALNMVDSSTVLTPLLFWLLYRFDSSTVLTPLTFWLLYCFDSSTFLTSLPFWLLYRFDSFTILTPLPFWLLYRFDILFPIKRNRKFW